MPFRYTSPFAVALLAVAALAGCQSEPAGIVAGTAHVEEIIQDLAGPDTPVQVLIPAAMCPGHFDVRPSDVQAAASSRAVLIQGWQERLPNVAAVVKAAGVDSGRLRVVGGMDNWMLPAVRAEAVGLVADELADLMPGRADELRRRATQRRDLIRAHAEAVRDRFAAAGVAGVPVLANVMQAPFVEWAGFDVRGTFAGGQELSVAELERLVALAAEDGVVLVIDNLQSGDTAASATLAEETGATRVVLSNFPGAFAESARWEDEVDANVDRLLAALEDAGHG